MFSVYSNQSLWNRMMNLQQFTETVTQMKILVCITDTSLYLRSVSGNKLKPCFLHKHLLDSVCLWQISTCNAAEANGIASYGSAYCMHSSWMEVIFWNALIFPHNAHLFQPSSHPFLTTKQDREREMNRLLCVLFFLPALEPGLL